MTELRVRTFECGTEKEAATKPMEEAAEVYGAWQFVRDASEQQNSLMLALWGDSLADELADCVTACCNLAARHGIDLQAAIGRVEEKNRKRGRYGRE